MVSVVSLAIALSI